MAAIRGPRELEPRLGADELRVATIRRNAHEPAFWGLGGDPLAIGRPGRSRKRHDLQKLNRLSRTNADLAQEAGLGAIELMVGNPFTIGRPCRRVLMPP